MVMQIKNNSAVKAYTINWSNGTKNVLTPTTTSSTSVCDVPQGIKEAESEAVNLRKLL